MRNRTAYHLAFLIVILLMCHDGYAAEPLSSLRTAVQPHTECIELSNAQGGTLLIVPKLGARAMGLSLDGPDGDNLLYFNRAVSQK